jgi:hypothetical protein
VRGVTLGGEGAAGRRVVMSTEKGRRDVGGDGPQRGRWGFPRTLRWPIFLGAGP